MMLRLIELATLRISRVEDGCWSEADWKNMLHILEVPSLGLSNIRSRNYVCSGKLSWLQVEDKMGLLDARSSWS